MDTKKYAGLFVAALMTVSIAGCMPNTVTDSEKAGTIVVQYSGGKEIGRWDLDGEPSFNKNGFISFRSGDSVIRISGDVRVISSKK